MTVEDLGHEATELVSLANGEAKSLSKLAELAVRQVPGCAAAHVTIWRDGELAAAAASHPDAGRAHRPGGQDRSRAARPPRCATAGR